MKLKIARYQKSLGIIGFLREEKGSNAIEYALLTSLISIAAIGLMIALGISVNQYFLLIVGGFR